MIPSHLQRIYSTFEKWLYLPSHATLNIVAATYLANRLAGSRVWLCLIGPSSCGKTTLVESLLSLPRVHPLDQITEGTFSSGYRSKEDPSATFGFFNSLDENHSHLLLIPDFSAILRQHPNVRGKIFGQLRRIYDGSWSQRFGTGVEVQWRGSIGMIACATPNFEREISAETTFGERFLYWKMPSLDPFHVAERSLRNSEKTDEMKKDLRKAMKPLSSLKLPENLRLPLGVRNILAKKASFVSFARTPVQRDWNSREILDIPRPESPARLSQQLGMLLKGLMVLFQTEEISEEMLELAEVAAYSSIPDTRLRFMGMTGGKLYDFSSAQRLSRLSRSVCFRTLEDLSEIGLLEKARNSAKKFIWRAREEHISDFRRVQTVMKGVGLL